MAKRVDITDKLQFDGNPVLIIKGQELEVNADAPTMLKIMNLVSEDGVEINKIHEAYELIFPEESRRKIEEMKLSINDWQIVVKEAMILVTGEETPGER